MNLSIIMTYRPDNGIRDRHFDWTVKRYKEILPDAELVIVRDDKEIGWETFNKSKAINEGFRRATKDVLLITDIDVVLPKISILESVKLLKDYSIITPYSILYKAGFGASNKILNSKPNLILPRINLNKCKKVELTKGQAQGIHIISKNNFIKVKGYDERFVGWGSEDSAFQSAVITMLGNNILKRCDGDAIHLKHDVVKNRQVKRDKQSGYLVEEYREAMYNKEKMRTIIDKKSSVGGV